VRDEETVNKQQADLPKFKASQVPRNELADAGVVPDGKEQSWKEDGGDGLFGAEAE